MNKEVEEFFNLNFGIAKDYEKFIYNIFKNSQTKPIETPFPEINKKLGGGLYPGLYTIGAISSLGKTALTLQISDYIAKNGNHVLFFSNEMLETDLFSRTISRIAYLDNPRENEEFTTVNVKNIFHEPENLKEYKTKTMQYTAKYFKEYKKIGVRCKNFTETIEGIEKHIIDFIKGMNQLEIKTDVQKCNSLIQAIERLKKENREDSQEYIKKFEIELKKIDSEIIKICKESQKRQIEGIKHCKENNIDSKKQNEMFDKLKSEIKQKIKNRIEFLEENAEIKPVVVIDYLQIIKVETEKKLNDKRQVTDYVVENLKRLSAKYNLIMIVVSSFGRGFYKDKACFESFKESGGIEYSSDVVIGLELKVLDEIANSKDKLNESQKTIMIDKAKSEDVRKLNFKLLKNRNGKSGITQGLNFDAKHNLFTEIPDIPNNNKRRGVF